jgi:hypothetical protein
MPTVTHSCDEEEWPQNSSQNLHKYPLVQWRIEKRRLFFEFNVPEYHTAEIFLDERVYIKVPF